MKRATSETFLAIGLWRRHAARFLTRATRPVMVWLITWGLSLQLLSPLTVGANPARPNARPRGTVAPGKSTPARAAKARAVQTNSFAVVSVSGASYEPYVAPDAIVSAFGTSLATRTEAAPSTPLPTTIAGTTVVVRDSQGVERNAALFFVSPLQINYLIPAQTAAGEAIVTVTAGNGVISQGTVQVTAAAISVFSATSNGAGIPAADVVRVRNGQLTLERTFEVDPVTNEVRARRLDFGPAGDRLLLQLYLTGLRGMPDPNNDGNANENVRVLIGDVEMVPEYAGRQPSFVGLDQINVEIPRALAGRGRVGLLVTANGFPTANAMEIELASLAGTTPPTITSLSATTATVGQSITINGTGFAATAAQNRVRIDTLDALVTAASPNQLTVTIPFGATSGKVTVQTPQGEVISSAALAIRTSLSGLVETTSRQPLAGATVRVLGTSLSTTTNAEGAFLLPDVAAGAVNLEIDGSTVPITSAYPKLRLRTTVVAGRDNRLHRPVALQYIKGASVSISPAGLVGEQSLVLKLDDSGGIRPEAQIAETANVVFDLPSGARITFPDGTNGGTLTLTQLESNRPPVNLPRGLSSSAIIQIAPFNGSFSQGGKLTFPNREGYASNATVKLYRLDQTLTSNSLGSFIEAGIATVSSDGKTIETQAGVITESGCYFVAAPRALQTLAGRVVDSQGNAVRNVFLSAAGQSVLSDGAGAFNLRLLSANLGEKVTIDATWQRPTGRVERLQREYTIPGSASNAGYFRLTPDLIFAAENSNRAPVILAPTSVNVAAGQTADVDVIVSDQDASQTVQLALSGASLATLSNVGGNNYRVRIAPGASDAGNFTLTLTATDSAGATTTQPIALTVTAPPPRITDFNPKNGTVGNAVVLTGTSLKTALGNPTVTFAGANGTRLQAFVSAATATQVTVTVPNGAVTGIIDLTTTLGRTTTNGNFTVDPSQSFALTLENNSATALQGGTATYIVRLTSNTPNFSQLAKLSLTGAPTGATVKFDPEQITAGAISTLSIMVPGNAGVGSTNLTVSAKALVDGNEVTRSASGTLNVQQTSQTTLSGRVLSTKSEPIRGAVVSIANGGSATTDASGSFLLSGVPAGNGIKIMVDGTRGTSASVTENRFPIIAEPVDIVAGQSNVVPYTFYLPAIDRVNEVTVNPSQTTVVTTPEAPGLTQTIPANAGLMNRDGTPVTKASITMVDIDRTPAPLPANVGTNMVFTSQPGGARPATGTVIPVVYPNLAGKDPGTRIELWNFDPDLVRWYIYGYGRVSSDGKRIEPEPGVGLPYFSWHWPNSSPNGNPSDCKPNQCPNPCTGKTVDLASGVKIEKTTDIAIGGARGGLELMRVYTSDLAGGCDDCPFGRGTKHNYDIRLTGSFQENGAGRLVLPEQVTGRLFSFQRKETDGTLLFSTSGRVGQLADVLKKLSNGTYEYRQGDGVLWRFDTNGRLTAIVDRNGNTTSLTYTGSNLTRVTDATGRSLTFSYTGGFISQVTDPLNRTWRYGYSSNLLTTITDPEGNITTQGFGTAGVLTSITDARGFAVKRITYAPNSSRVIRQDFADGGFETYEYKLAGTVVTETKMTDVLGRVTIKRFNADGYVIGEVDELGQASDIKRELGTNVALEIKGPCGCAESTNNFDPKGQLKAKTDRLGQKSEYNYDPNFTFVTSYTDPLGRITRMTYDNKGNRLSMTDALGRITNYTYDSFGQLQSIRDPLGHTTRFGYDANGYVNSVTDALNNVTSFEYDAVGRLKKITDAESRSTNIVYDNNDRIATVTDPAGVVTRYEYDENDNRTAVINAQNKKWTFAYDAKNRVQRSTDPLNQTTQYRYNAVDEMTAMVSPSGRAVRYEYDNRGQRTKIIDPLQGEIRFTYDNRKNLTSLTDQRGNTTTFVYDQLYRLIAQRDPLGRETRFSYDAVGNLITKLDRLNRQTQIAYDALNRPGTITYVDATVSYNFDEAGRLTRINDTQSGAIEWAYDDANRMLSEKTPQGTVSYSYNKANQRATMTAADRPVVNYGYDTAGRLSTIKQGAETFTWAYDELSRMKSLSRPNNVTTSYEYDAANKLSRILHANVLSGLALEDLKYTYNADNQIEAIASLIGNTLLPTAKSVANTDAANRLSRIGQIGYVFDEEGQTSTKTDNQGTTTYDWDARGRLVKVTLSSGQSINYGYDVLGRRRTRMANGLSKSFLYDGRDIVLDRGTGGLLTDYLNGPGIDNKLRQGSVGTTPLYFLQDNLQSTIGVSGASGQLLERISYEPHGNNSISSLTRYGFTGREHDETTGLIYYRARYYDSLLGKFITEDPIGLNGGVNYYIYAENNPLSFTDPLGQFATCAPSDFTCQADSMNGTPPPPTWWKERWKDPSRVTPANDELTKAYICFFSSANGPTGGLAPAGDAKNQRDKDPYNIPLRNAEHYLYGAELYYDGGAAWAFGGGVVHHLWKWFRWYTEYSPTSPPTSDSWYWGQQGANDASRRKPNEIPDFCEKKCPR